MRLFPGDHVPTLSAFLQEMRAPWILPPSFAPSHRQRIASLVGRAACTADPGLRFIQLRWADRWLLAQGGLHLPSRVLTWWRIEPITDNPANVLSEAPHLVPGHHLFDFDLDPGLSSLGWLGPLKVRLLECITTTLVDERPLDDPEPVLDLLDDAARRDPDHTSPEASSRFARALSRVGAHGPLPPDVHRELLAVSLAEPSPEVRLSVLDWLLHPGVVARVEQRLGAASGLSERPPPPAEPTAEVSVRDVARVEAEAEAVLEEIRAGRDRQWTPQRAFEAASFLMDYLKTRAPFWKLEERPDGQDWVAAKDTDDVAAARWAHSNKDAAE